MDALIGLVAAFAGIAIGFWLTKWEKKRAAPTDEKRAGE
jgi:hypothetical protein